MHQMSHVNEKKKNYEGAGDYSAAEKDGDSSYNNTTIKLS